jgi:cytochrome c-type biogenesis protein
LVPAYLSFLGGVTFEQAPHARSRAALARAFSAALAFVLGFVLVFVALGASATLLGRVLADQFGLLAKIAGVTIVLFGIHYTGLVNLRFLNYEARFHPVARRAGVATAFVMGLAFAFGWTPCVGPVLATVLVVAGSSPSMLHGVLLLSVYGLGLGIPFVAASLAVGPFVRAAAALRSRMRWIEVSLGAIMIATGVFIFVGSIANVSAWLIRAFPVLSRIG